MNCTLMLSPVRRVQRIARRFLRIETEKHLWDGVEGRVGG
jgi:hypothetical protein